MIIQSFMIIAVVAAFINAILQLIQKYVIKYSFKDILILLFYLHLIMALFVPILFIFGGYASPTSVLLILIPQAFFYITGEYLLYRVFQKLDVSVVGPLFPTQQIFVPILGFLFLGERLNPLIYLMMLGIIFGAIIISYNEQSSFKGFLQKPVLWLILSMFLFALSNLFISFGLRTLSPLQLQAWQSILVLLFTIPFIFMGDYKERIPNAKQLISVTTIATVLTLFIVIFFYALKQNFTITSALVLLNGSIVFVLSFVLSKIRPAMFEHHSNQVYAIRFIGVLLVVLSAIGIVLVY